jgi:predicted PurR-regulated permease PerM
MKATKIEISHRTVIFTVALLVGLWMVWQLRTILVYLLVAVVMMTALSPTVDRIERWRIGGRRLPRPMAILVLYLAMFGVLGLAIAGIVQPLVSQTSALLSNLPGLIERLGLPEIDERILATQLDLLGSIPGNAVRLIVGVFSNVLAVFTISVMGFYLILEREKLHKHLTMLLGEDEIERRVERLIDRLERRMGGWVRGELLLMAIVGVMSYVGLAVLGVPFALPLAILAGLLEVFPNVGPVVATVPAAILGFTLSPFHGTATIAWFFVVQQLENNLIVPQVMAKAAGVNPLVTIMALMAGFSLGGVLGAILAVPVVLLIFTVVEEVMGGRTARR